MPDNPPVAPWGDLIICEDNPGIDRLWGITPSAASSPHLPLPYEA